MANPSPLENDRGSVAVNDEPPAAREMPASEESLFSSWDGTRLFYRAWPSRSASNKAIIFLHRGHEHSGRLHEQASAIGMNDFQSFAYDLRGHGRSPGERGDANDFYDHVRDLNAFVRHVAKSYCIPVENMALVANSISSVVAAAWVLDYAPRIRAMVLAAPAFRVRLYVPFAVPGLRILQKFAGRRFVSSYVKARLLTHDRQEIDSYNADELISRRIGTHMLLGLHDLSTRIMQDAGAIVTPTLVLAAGSDFVVSNSAIRRFYNRLSSPTKDLELYPGFFHAILYEAKRADALAKSRGFIEERFASNVDRSPLLAGDDAGYTKEEYQRLRVTAHPIKALGFTSLKLAIRTIGRLSDGIRLGWRTGFDSGESLDYVYRNEARGTTAIGRQIDRAYLNSVGWRAMRARQANLSAILEDTIRRVAASGRDVRIFDTAAGGGRYVLQALQATGDLNVSATLLDKDPAAVAAGEAHADSLGIESVCFAIGDAFDAATLRALSTMPNIIVASGFYELFPDNRRVSLSLSALAELLDPDGYLIYTGMPWHPQLEMIARTCVNRDGEAWIMRRRSTAELDELVRSVGLEKTDTRIDPWGVSTVSIARKRRNNL